jgi:hypothetical protein
MPCDELRDDQRCPYCQSVPGSYTDDGDEFCWLHRERLAGEYPVADNHFFTTYAWRGHESRFPNAKLYEAYGDERVAGMSPFCRKCQEILEQWRTNWEID